MQRRHRIALTIALLVVMVASFMAGRQFQILADSTTSGLGAVRALRATRVASAAGASGAQGRDEVDLQPLETFGQVLENIDRFFVSPVGDRRQLTYGAIRGMLAALDDPYTRFMEPQEYQSFQEENQGRFEGVGATIGLTEVKGDDETAKVTPGLRCPACGSEIRLRSFRLTIVAPLPGSPAAKAGVEAGDLVLKIDGAPTDGMTVSEAAKRIRGERGTTVKLLLGREGAAAPVPKEIVRGPIELATVETKLLDDGIGLMRVNYFHDDTGRAVATGLRKLRAQHMRGLVLDIRDNPGGLLNRCLEVVHQFVAAEPVVYVQERGQPMRPFYDENGKGSKFDLPLVALINRGSASASEILAGAIQDAKVGRLVGTATYGKGSVQTILPLSDGSAMALTTSKWYTLSRRDIDHKGVTPDVAAETAPEAVRNGPDDLQYQQALQLLRQQIAARN